MNRRSWLLALGGLSLGSVSLGSGRGPGPQITHQEIVLFPGKTRRWRIIGPCQLHLRNPNAEEVLVLATKANDASNRQLGGFLALRSGMWWTLESKEDIQLTCWRTEPTNGNRMNSIPVKLVLELEAAGFEEDGPSSYGQ